MSKKELFFDHDFLEKSIAGMLWYIRELMKPYKNTLNNDTFFIGIKNTGDESFLFEQIDEGHTYDRVPNWIFHILGVNTINADRTNPFENGTFSAKTKNSLGKEKLEHFSAPVARRPLEVGFSTEVKFSTIFEYFRFVEIYLTLSTFPHIYSFEHSGRIHYGQFTFPELADSDANVTFEFAAEKRERKLPINFNLILQFPAYQIYGIPGTANEGFNGDGGTGNGGGTDNVVSAPMIKIIHNLMPKFVGQKETPVVLTQIIAKPESENPESELI